MQVDELDFAEWRKQLLELLLRDVRQRVGEAANVQAQGRLARRGVVDGLLRGLRRPVLLGLGGLDSHRLALDGLSAQRERLQSRLLEVELDVGQAFGSACAGVADDLHIAHLACVRREELVHIAFVRLVVQAHDHHRPVAAGGILDLPPPLLLLLPSPLLLPLALLLDAARLAALAPAPVSPLPAPRPRARSAVFLVALPVVVAPVGARGLLRVVKELLDRIEVEVVGHAFASTRVGGGAPIRCSGLEPKMP
mmetsp:Transcript_94911/g.273203  ORF Transcript_94911/g.273203 Transcript_94911/m.273203 type:complete len:252 (+) Transcript_94911:742-1497(+)